MRPTSRPSSGRRAPLPDHDRITLTLPPDREFQGIAHLVLGGIALRHELTIETLEDLQLAVGAVLDRVEPDEPATVTLSVSATGVEARIGPVRLNGALDGGPGGAGGDFTLARVLWTVVDDVAVDGEWVRLTKKVSERV